MSDPAHSIRTALPHRRLRLFDHAAAALHLPVRHRRRTYYIVSRALLPHLAAKGDPRRIRRPRELIARPRLRRQRAQSAAIRAHQADAIRLGRRERNPLPVRRPLRREGHGADCKFHRLRHGEGLRLRPDKSRARHGGQEMNYQTLHGRESAADRAGTSIRSGGIIEAPRSSAAMPRAGRVGAYDER